MYLGAGGVDYEASSQEDRGLISWLKRRVGKRGETTRIINDTITLIVEKRVRIMSKRRWWEGEESEEEWEEEEELEEEEE